MRHLKLAAAMVVAMAGTAFAADPLEGTWRTAKDDNGNFGLIKVTTCGAKLCGTLVQSFDSTGKKFKSKNHGRKIISETVATGGGSYKGKIFSPDRGKTYKSKLQLSGSKLKVSGCVLAICRDGGTWTRAK